MALQCNQGLRCLPVVLLGVAVVWFHCDLLVLAQPLFVPYSCIPSRKEGMSESSFLSPFRGAGWGEFCYRAMCEAGHARCAAEHVTTLHKIRVL